MIFYTLLFTSALSFGQDSSRVLPKRYIKIAGAPFLRLEAEWKQSEQKSKNLALNVYFDYNFYNGFKLQASNRRYSGKKNRKFWAYHAGIGYIERVTMYRYFEKTTYPGPPDVIYETEEVRYKKHKWITAGIGTGVGFQRMLGKKCKWLLEGSVGIQYYYYYYREPKSETGSTANGAKIERSWETSELEELWEKTPWENSKRGRLWSISKGIGTPFSLLYCNVLIGHNF